MRLTNKIGTRYFRKNKVLDLDLEDKLGQLEDIEDELGISLVKLLSVKKVYYMDWNRDCSGFVIRETYKIFINLTERTIEYYENANRITFELEIQNYGKKDTYGGWAFTKEELL